MYRDSASYLREWIEFHRLVGVERFFLYDNLSQDDHLEVLAPYLETGTVVLKHWAEPFAEIGGLLKAHEDCLSEHRDDSRWIAFLDIDEFLFSPTGQPVSAILEDYSAWSGVGVNWIAFGTSGHRTRPPGLVIENYVRRAADRRSVSRIIKSIVQPEKVARAETVHHFSFRSGCAVDENMKPIDGFSTEEHSARRLRINHYWTKSEEECRQKSDLWAKVGAPRDLDQVKLLAARYNEAPDHTIMGYVPALREVLGR